MRVYASQYRSDVAGIILVEGGCDNPWRLVKEKLVRAEELAMDKPILPVKTTGPLTESDIPSDALKQWKAGAAGLVRGANDPPRDKLPSDANVGTFSLATCRGPCESI